MQKGKQKGYQLKLTDMLPLNGNIGKKAEQKKEQKEDEKKNQEVKSIDSELSAKTEEIVSIPNVQFHLGKRPSAPQGDLIEVIHKKWWGDYTLLEKHHGFIQWLFPNLFKSRFNSEASPLTKEEINQFLTNKTIYTNYIKSYQLILDFYGMHLKNKQTGEIAQSRHPTFKQRAQQTLLTHFHNHMRLTRIMSSLMTVGFASYAIELHKFLKAQYDWGILEPLQKYLVYEKQWKDFSNIKLEEHARSEFFKQIKSPVVDTVRTS